LARLNALRQEFGALAVLAGPIVVGQVAQVANGFIDTVMAGRLGALDLGAIAIGANLWIPVYLFCVGLMMALSSLVSHLFGAGRLTAIRDLMKQALLLALLLGVLAFMAVRQLAGMLDSLGVNADIAPIAAEYAVAVAWGMPPVCVYLALRFLSEGIGYTRPMMVIQLLSLLLNGLLNYVLMFGKLGVPAMGAVGAGWATAVVMWVNLLMLLGYASRHSRFDVIRSAAVTSLQWRRGLAMLRLGLPIAAALTAEIGMFAAIALLMGRFGVIEAAAHQLAVNFTAMTFMIPLGLSAAITIRVGHALGRGDAAAARFRGQAGIALAGLCMLVTASVMLFLPGMVIAIYTREVVVAELAVSFLLLAALFQMSDGLQVAAMGALRGYKDTLWPMLAAFTAYWLVGVPLAWYLGFFVLVRPQGLWVALIVSLTLVAVLLLWRFRRLSVRALGGG